MRYPRLFLGIATLMVLATVDMDIAVGDTRLVGSVRRITDAGPDVEIVNLPAAVQGVTLNPGGTAVSLPGGHSFQVNDIVDVHWGDESVRRGSRVSLRFPFLIIMSSSPAPEGETVIPIDEVVWVSAQTSITVDVDPAKLALVATGVSRQSYTDFRDSIGTLFLRKMDRLESWFWMDDFTWENVLLGGENVIEIRTSTRDVRGSQFYVFFHFNS